MSLAGADTPRATKRRREDDDASAATPTVPTWGERTVAQWKAIERASTDGKVSVSTSVTEAGPVPATIRHMCLHSSFLDPDGEHIGGSIHGDPHAPGLSAALDAVATLRIGGDRPSWYFGATFDDAPPPHAVTKLCYGEAEVRGLDDRAIGGAGDAATAAKQALADAKVHVLRAKLSAQGAAAHGAGRSPGASP